MEKLAPNVCRQVVNLDFRQGLPMPLNVVTLLRDSSGAVKGSGGADGTAATVGQGVRPTRGGAGRWVKQQEIVVQWGTFTRGILGGIVGCILGDKMGIEPTIAGVHCFSR